MKKEGGGGGRVTGAKNAQETAACSLRFTSGSRRPRSQVAADMIVNTVLGLLLLLVLLSGGTGKDTRRKKRQTSAVQRAVHQDNTYCLRDDSSASIMYRKKIRKIYRKSFLKCCCQKRTRSLTDRAVRVLGTDTGLRYKQFEMHETALPGCCCCCCLHSLHTAVLVDTPCASSNRTSPFAVLVYCLQHYFLMVENRCV